MNAKIYYTSVIVNIVMLGGTARILFENADCIEKGGEVGNGIGCTKEIEEEWNLSAHDGGYGMSGSEVAQLTY